MRANERDPNSLATELGVDPKTVDRWVNGRTPHKSHRQRVATSLGTSERYLWPEANQSRELERSQAELVALYPHRADVPRELWRRLLTTVEQRLDVLVYAALFLPENFPDLIDVLRQRARGGCKTRIGLGDPDSEVVRNRGAEERYGDGIDLRARVSLRHYQHLLGEHGVTVALHATTLYNSLYRFDDELLVSPHLWGLNGFLAPVMHLKRIEDGTLFDMYSDNFDAVWEQARPVEQLREELER